MKDCRGKRPVYVEPLSSVAVSVEFYNMEINMSDMPSHKQCKCKSSSSGPRVVQINDDDKIVAYAFVKMACDKCDMPWGFEPIRHVHYDEFIFDTSRVR